MNNPLSKEIKICDFEIADEADNLEIGNVGPGGGFIFFVDHLNRFPGFTYLEAAPTDAATSITWCDDMSTLLDLNVWGDNALGRGRVNTDLMLANSTSGAAYAAKNYISPNGTNDWYLPYLDELMLMYTNLKQVGVGGFANALYWSSSQFDKNGAWVKDFKSGEQGAGYKLSKLRVRAVRAF